MIAPGPGKGFAGLLLLPGIAFPVASGALLVADHAVGERHLVRGLLFERRAFAETFLGDYLAALPWMYVAFALLAAVILAIGRKARPAPVWAAVVAAALGFVTGAFLAGSALSASAFALGIAGTALGLPFGWSLTELTAGRKRRRS